MDTNQDYMINKEELMNAMASLGLESYLTDEQAETMINELDTNNNGDINY